MTTLTPTSYIPTLKSVQPSPLVKSGLFERVRRACLYVSSPQFPPSISGSGGHTTLMRAASAVVSGFPYRRRAGEACLRCVLTPGVWIWGCLIRGLHATLYEKCEMYAS